MKSIYALLVAAVLLAVASFPLAWLVMLFLGNLGVTYMTFWGSLPLGIILTVLAGAAAGERNLFIFNSADKN